MEYVSAQLHIHTQPSSDQKSHVKEQEKKAALMRITSTYILLPALSLMFPGTNRTWKNKQKQ